MYQSSVGGREVTLNIADFSLFQLWSHLELFLWNLTFWFILLLYICCSLLFSHLVMSDSFATPRTVACQVPLSMGFLRQEYLSGLPFPSPGNLPISGIELASPALVGGYICVCVCVCVCVTHFFIYCKQIY